MNEYYAEDILDIKQDAIDAEARVGRLNVEDNIYYSVNSKATRAYIYHAHVNW